MSGENVQIVREVCAAWERGDFSGFEWADPAIELVEDPRKPDPEVYSGIDAMRRAWRAWLRSWDGFRVRPQEFLDVGDEVLVLVEFAGRGKASGVSVDALHVQGAAAVFTFGDAGTVVRLRLYLDRAVARADLGVP